MSFGCQLHHVLLDALDLLVHLVLDVLDVLDLLEVFRDGVLELRDGVLELVDFVEPVREALIVFAYELPALRLGVVHVRLDYARNRCFE